MVHQLAWAARQVRAREDCEVTGVCVAGERCVHGLCGANKHERSKCVVSRSYVRLYLTVFGAHILSQNIFDFPKPAPGTSVTT